MSRTKITKTELCSAYATNFDVTYCVALWLNGIQVTRGLLEIVLC